MEEQEPKSGADREESRRTRRQQERLAHMQNRNDEEERPPRTFDPDRAAEQATVFGNRLKKWRAHLWKWAKRTDTGCFRIYDRDIPELPFVVDEYERHLHISEILRFRWASEADEEAWTGLMIETASRYLAVEPHKVFVKTREQQKGHRQYTKFGSDHHVMQVKEAGLTFEVNMTDYLDTGLFLDHRDTRAMVGSLSLNARVLNLFSYTGSFGVHAASGGAQSVLNVDLSNTYSEWGRRNMELNGFTGSSYRCEAADVMKWLPEAVRRKEVYDIIVLDPPTFSNSNKMEGIFDVQKDHPWMINQCLRLLSRDGILVFSNNFRKFRLDERELRTRYIDDISFRTTPEDFKGKKPHRCWVIKRDN